eukprot:CAMPEP_0170796512 /NCGR_PEP_ID=MMETSP0733-20121128/24918_1 /TAXON_ID=186038 /ORGANISM="Fragilariopsis kerguelensis, Strain L26-C5" /LENGTH=263 /DNA_ID=CAMNT_0011146915 /DNA_START=361 /DNA_END=1153 /DNA_ORIENTATION=+
MSAMDNSGGDDARDRHARRDAGRKALVDLGKYKTEEIERMIASPPPKSEKETKKTNIVPAAPYIIIDRQVPPLVAQRQPAVFQYRGDIAGALGGARIEAEVVVPIAVDAHPVAPARARDRVAHEIGGLEPTPIVPNYNANNNANNNNNNNNNVARMAFDEARIDGVVENEKAARDEAGLEAYREMLDQAFGGFPSGLHQAAVVEKKLDGNQMFIPGERGGITAEGRAGETLDINRVPVADPNNDNDSDDDLALAILLSLNVFE